MPNCTDPRGPAPRAPRGNWWCCCHGRRGGRARPDRPGAGWALPCRTRRSLRRTRQFSTIRAHGAAMVQRRRSYTIGDGGGGARGGALARPVHRRRTGAGWGWRRMPMRWQGSAGRDDRAVRRASPARAARHTGVFRGAAGAGARGRDDAVRPCCWCMARRTMWCPRARATPKRRCARAGVPVDIGLVPGLGHGIDDIGISVGALFLQRVFAGTWAPQSDGAMTLPPGCLRRGAGGCHKARSLRRRTRYGESRQMLPACCALRTKGAVLCPMVVNSFPALVLNADFRPLSYFPFSVWAWQEAVKAVFLDRVSVLNEYDDEVRSPRWRCGCQA